MRSKHIITALTVAGSLGALVVGPASADTPGLSTAEDCHQRRGVMRDGVCWLQPRDRCWPLPYCPHDPPGVVAPPRPASAR